MKTSVSVRRLLRVSLLTLAGAAVILLAVRFRPTLVQHQRLRALLESPAIDPEGITEALENATDPGASLLALWRSGRFAHRNAVLVWVLANVPHRHALGALRESLLVEAASDPDYRLRELAVGSLQTGSPSNPVALIAPQLTDADPELRQLGLQALRRVGNVGWTPVVLPRLSDPDPVVIATADSLLHRWSGIDTGLRLADVLSARRGLPARDLDDAIQSRLASLPAIRSNWWNARVPSERSLTSLPPVPTVTRAIDDFALEDLDGQVRRLSEFRGRTVLLNFWASWCTTCMTEFPALAELQASRSNRVAVLGVCLDSLTRGPLAGTNRLPASTEAELREIRRYLRPIVGRHHLTYPVLLDPENHVGPRFDACELPTQVVIDPDGRVVRRFTGLRTAEVWKALIDSNATDADRH